MITQEFVMESTAEVINLMDGRELVKVCLVERKAAVPLSAHLRQMAG